MIKRLTDLVFTCIGFLILSPIGLFLAILVIIKHGSQVMFQQQRAGLKGNSFTFYNFRTMTYKTNCYIYFLIHCLTYFGNFHRKLSLDDLPSLFNILNGDMGLVGPRPLPMQYLPLYNELQKRHQEVRTVIIALVQINDQNSLLQNKKFELDVRYVENQSFWLNLKILFLTNI